MDELHSGQDQAPPFLRPYTLRAYRPPLAVADTFPGLIDPTTEPSTPNPSTNTPSYSADTYTYVDCQPTDQIGSLVYAVSGAYAVATADANYPYPVVGVLTQKVSDRRGVVQRYGNIVGVYSNLTVNARGYLGHAGAIIYPPLPANDIRFSQQVGYATSATTFFVQLNGSVVQRDVTGTQLAFYVGTGAPQQGASYPQQNVYIDQDTGQTYYEPVADGAPSEVFVGSGAPPANLDTLAAQDVYFDEDSQTLYVAPDTNNPAQSQFALGHGAPSGTITQTTYSYYLDESSGLLYAM